MVGLCAASFAADDDTRQLAPLPAAAQARLRDEMLGNLRALSEILGLLAAGQVKQAGSVAEQELGYSAMGKNRSLPFEARPGAHMPAAMHQLGIEGHAAASQFARIAASGDRDQAIAALPSLTAACVACHHAYRIR
jgi:hypothetical protein